MTSDLSETAHQRLGLILGTIVGALQLPDGHPLRQDILAMSGQWERASGSGSSSLGSSSSACLKVAVFGPFNHGKSTLLNAILGQRTLPIDLIPTTGAAIRVRYGDKLQTQIRRKDGQRIVESGTDILKQFAILDDDRRMRSDVADIIVSCPHPLLKSGIELIDLPGTNDRDEQDQLVKAELLKADLVLQVLDGRKLMTLGERENLRDWLLDRGITTVIFVVNFLNLLEPEEQRNVYTRLRFVAESFRSDLPPGISNLYRVDALPALRARLKGDTSADLLTELSLLESALETIATQPNIKAQSQQPRLTIVADQVQQVLQQRIQSLAAEQAASAQQIATKKRSIQERAQPLLKTAFDAELTKFRQWLSFETMIASYQFEVAVALQSNAFESWEQGAFKTKANAYLSSLTTWVTQACDIFDRPQPIQPIILFPTIPEEIADRVSPPSIKAPAEPGKSRKLPLTVAAGMGWVLGGPVGAAVLGTTSYALTSMGKRKGPDETASSQEEMASLCQMIGGEYLRHFSNLNLAALDQYATTAEGLLLLPPDVVQPQGGTSSSQHQLGLLRSLADQLDEAIAELAPAS
jgi:hypothetical protein